MKLDLLAIASHPDDIELSCSGTIAAHISRGKQAGVIDLTRGELGTRGSPDIREKEARKSSEILGLSVRENLEMPDGFFEISKENMIAIARKIRKYRPTIVLANAVRDRHPDHSRAARLIAEACFYSGLSKIPIAENGKELDVWRPKAIYNYIQSSYIRPDIIVDISDFWDIKEKCIRTFASQFYDPDSKEPETYISQPGFIEFVENRSKIWGHTIGVSYGEGFTVNREMGVRNLFDLI